MLKDIPDSVAISFLDDGVINSAEVEDHICNIRTVLTAYREVGLKLAVKKCNFFADKITYLGHVLNEKGTRPFDSYVDAIKKWPLPRYKTEATMPGSLNPGWMPSERRTRRPNGDQ